MGSQSAKTFGTALRAEAARLRSLRLALPDNHPDRFALGLRECLIYTVLGFSLGLTVGYATHVVADMTTPRGVPLVARAII